jgi:hypothetical protein
MKPAEAMFLQAERSGLKLASIGRIAALVLLGAVAAGRAIRCTGTR